MEKHVTAARQKAGRSHVNSNGLCTPLDIESSVFRGFWDQVQKSVNVFSPYPNSRRRGKIEKIKKIDDCKKRLGKSSFDRFEIFSEKNC